jgi:hypothetical protein
MKIFCAFAFKVCKKCYDPQKIFLKKIKLGFKNAEFCADFQLWVMLTEKNAPKKVEGKKLCEF